MLLLCQLQVTVEITHKEYFPLVEVRVDHLAKLVCSALTLQCPEIRDAGRREDCG